MKLQIGKIYREKNIAKFKDSFIIILKKLRTSEDDIICRLLRISEPDDEYNEYEDVLEDILVEAKDFYD